MKYYKDTDNNPFAFEDNVTADIIAKVEATHKTTLTKITIAQYKALIAPTFAELQDTKTNEINTACATQITSGFTSKALGTIRTYQSQELDQLNLIGVVTGGTDDYFKCAKTVKGKLIWTYEMHTIAQLKQVLNDGKVHKQTLLQKAGTLKDKVALAKTQANLDLIVW